MLMRASTIIRRQVLLKSNTFSQEIVTHRHIHLVAQGKTIFRSNTLLDLHTNCRITGISLIRYASTDEVSSSTPSSTPTSPPISQSSPYDEIPDPPTPIQEIIENIVKVHPNGEPTFESLGLGGWSPSGIVQNFLEFMHINLNMPWWLTIVTATVCARALIFPLVINSQKNMIKVTNHMPVIQEMHQRLTEARNSGDHMESAKAATEMMQYMKKNNVSMTKNFMAPLIQAPVFISFFFALKKMANLPVESLKEGGFLWVKDLTVYDPYYIMPIVTSVTMFITIELGTDGANIHAMGMFRYVLRAVPFIALPFMLHFPGTILTYWVATNTVSLLQTAFLKIPRIKKALNMPTLIKRNVPAVTNKKGFVKEVQESWTNLKITKQLSDRERADTVQFNSAGKGPIIKTFKYDPTKQKQSTTVLTKSRE
ncbi:mitochondrial inner membrane protein OXA1L [Solenopsis invicta]|uniref:mitochondrial inner membrane protein OXA1L n=1 Tax=Solenopsis invicta TaxID=13686 RepID=UPI0005958CB9|nr:mitochondrial inner membrane protein OXA1L [Solenopsis invicta]